jgi:hypothetical protein
MKKIFLSAIIGTLLFSACDKDKEDSKQEQGQEQPQNDTLCCVSGKIFLYNTGNTVSGAWLQFCDYNTDAIAHSELIDDDGTYETKKIIKKGIYYPRILKIDHVDTLYYFNGKEDRKIEVNPLSTGCTPIDWAISAEAKTLWVVDINNPEQRIDMLDFGDYDNRRYFQIRNKGGVRFNWWINKQNYDWIKSITPAISGTLKLNGYINLEIEIDRSKLLQSPATFLIDSDEGGGRILTVKISSNLIP